MQFYYAVQVGLPLALLLWLCLLPPRSRLGLVLLAIATAVWITAAELAGLWLVVPYWLTSILAIGALIGTWLSWRARPRPSWPGEYKGWLAPALCAALIISGGGVIVDWFTAHNPPTAEAVRLASPLGRGNYRVVNGGNSRLVNAHLMTLDRSDPRFRPYYGQSMGLDIVRLNEIGRTTYGLRPSNPARYEIFGDAVRAPCKGRVVTAVDGLPDMPVPRTDRTAMAGNHAVIECAGYQVLLGHLRQGSVRVRAGDHVKTSQLIGQVGNSGNSEEPHLHIHAQLPGTAQEPFSGAPVPILIGGRYLVRNDTV